MALRVFVKLVSPAIIGYTCPPTWSYGIPCFRNAWPDAVSVLINISRFLDFGTVLKWANLRCLCLERSNRDKERDPWRKRIPPGIPLMFQIWLEFFLSCIYEKFSSYLHFYLWKRSVKYFYSDIFRELKKKKTNLQALKFKFKFTINSCFAQLNERTSRKQRNSRRRDTILLFA